MSFKGKDPGDLDRFYIIAPQAEPPQSLDASFRHDHVTRDIPAQNGGAYSVRLHGYFVICSASGIASGACVFESSSPGPGFTLPLAKTVNGGSLTSAAAVEAGVDAGLLTLVDTGAVIVGTTVLMVAEAARAIRRREWRAPIALIALCAIPLLAGSVRLATLAAGVTVTPENARFFGAPAPSCCTS